MRLIKNSICVILFTICLNAITYGHPGGHYHKEDLSVLHHWDISISGNQVIGNFMMSKNDMVFIEGIDGKIFTVPMNLFSKNDKSFANQEIDRINKLNNNFVSISSTDSINETGWNLNNLLLLFFIASLGIGFYSLAVYANKRKFNVQWRLLFSSLTALTVVLFFLSCKKNNPVVIVDGGIPKTSTSFIDSAFTPYKPAIATNWDASNFYVSSNGIPAHNMMVGITSWQQQVPLPQSYTGTNHWTIPLQPVYATMPLSTRTNFMKGAVAIAVNGIPIFNALNNRGEDAFAIGELDQWGGHCGKGDDYHYHAAPLNLSTTSGLKPIAFALDGFAVYGNKEPDGANMQALDTCHGHIYANGVYHYHGTTTYPYVVGAMKGKVAIDPATPAPENQILPQAFATPIRPALTPLRGATITNFTAPNTNAYNLTYMIGTKSGHVNYNWDNLGNYNFEFIDTSGTTTTASYHH